MHSQLTLMIEQGLAELGQGLAELGQGPTGLEQGLIELGQGLTELGQGLVELGQGLAELGQGLTGLEQGLIELGQGLTELEQGLAGPEQGLAGPEQELAGLVSGRTVAITTEIKYQFLHHCANQICFLLEGGLVVRHVGPQEDLREGAPDDQHKDLHIAIGTVDRKVKIKFHGKNAMNNVPAERVHSVNIISP